MPNQIYFGTKDRMAWVKAPASGTSLDLESVFSIGTDVNGGGYALRGGASHRNPSFEWGASPSQDVYDITDYYSGVYGSGLLYWLDPFAMRSNVCPQDLTIPSKTGFRSFLHGVTLTETTGSTAASGLPTRGLTLAPTLGTSNLALYMNEISIPVPPGHVAWIRQYATADLFQVRVGSTSAQVNGRTAAATFTAGANGDFLNIRYAGVAGTFYGLQITIGPSVVVPTKYSIGRGHSGCRFAAAPKISGITANLGDTGGLVGGSVQFKEVGLWQYGL